MNSNAQPPLLMGPLISAALNRVWHFKFELLVLWLGFVLSALIFVPFFRDFEAQIVSAIQPGAHVQHITIDSGTVVRLFIVGLVLALFRSTLTVLWLRVLRLGTVLAFDGGVKMLAIRTFGLFLRCLALLMVFVGILLILRFLLGAVLTAVVGAGTTIGVPQLGVVVGLIIILVAFGALTIRVSFALVSPVFDIVVPIERAWKLVEGNTFRILTAIIAICFPIEFLGSLVQSAVIRIGPAAAQEASAVAAVAQTGIGTLMASAVIGSVTNCVEIAIAAAILIEAYERLGGWGRGQYVSEVV